MRKLTVYFFWAVVVSVAAFINAGDSFGYKSILDALTGQTAAAWVQAVGSVGAIIAGFSVARFSLESQRAETKRKEDDTLRAHQLRQFTHILIRYRTLLAWCGALRRKMFSSEGISEAQVAANENLASLFGAITGTEIPRLDMIDALVKVDIALTNLGARLKKLSGRIHLQTDKNPDVESALDYITRVEDLCKPEIEKCENGIFFVKGGSIWVED